MIDPRGLLFNLFYSPLRKISRVFLHAQKTCCLVKLSSILTANPLGLRQEGCVSWTKAIYWSIVLGLEISSSSSSSSMVVQQYLYSWLPMKPKRIFWYRDGLAEEKPSYDNGPTSEHLMGLWCGIGFRLAGFVPIIFAMVFHWIY